MKHLFTFETIVFLMIVNYIFLQSCYFLHMSQCLQNKAKPGAKV